MGICKRRGVNIVGIMGFLIFIVYVAVIIIVIKTIILIWSFKKHIYRIETMDSELKEIRRLLEDKKS
jgi:hypothetical protein